MALEQLGRNSEDLNGLRADLNSEHQSQLDIREVSLRAQETELRGTHPNCVFIINTVHIFPNHFISYVVPLGSLSLPTLSMHYDCVPRIIFLLFTLFYLCSGCMRTGTSDGRYFIFSRFKIFALVNL